MAPLAALRYRDFRLLFFGDTVSITGTQMRRVAVNWQVYQLALADATLEPALALGLIGLAQLVPLVLSVLVSGLVADRSDRRRIILVTSLVALISSTALAVASWLEAVPLPLIYGIVALTAAATAFETPARQALRTSLVPPRHLASAVSLNVTASQLATILGPTLAGLLIAVGGSALVYWIDAVTFLAVVVAVALMKTDARPRLPPGERTAPVAAAVEGLRFIFSNRLIASTMLLDFFATLFGAVLTLLPLFADQVLHVGAVELGWLYAAPSAGAMVAALALTSLQIERQGLVLLGAVVLYGASTALFGLSQALPLSLLALAGTGAADTVSMVIRQTLRQLQTPDALRGRMTAAGMLFFAGGPRLGDLASGFLASLVGAPLAVALGGTLCILSALAINARVPELGRYRLDPGPAE